MSWKKSTLVKRSLHIFTKWHSFLCVPLPFNGRQSWAEQTQLSHQKQKRSDYRLHRGQVFHTALSQNAGKPPPFFFFCATVKEGKLLLLLQLFIWWHWSVCFVTVQAMLKKGLCESSCEALFFFFFVGEVGMGKGGGTMSSFFIQRQLKKGDIVRKKTNWLFHDRETSVSIG